LSKNGGAWANTSATLTAIGNGAYYVELTAAELDTLGHIGVRYKSANTTERFVEHDVVAFNHFTANVTVGGFAAAALTAINAEVVDCLATDTYAEPSSVPAATASLEDKIGWLFALARNKVSQTSSLMTLRNDADSASIGTASVSDDTTTFTRNEWT
jgi:hypothetical protein